MIGRQIPVTVQAFKQEKVVSNFTKKQIENEFKIYSKNVKKEDIIDVLKKENAVLKKMSGPLRYFRRTIIDFFSLVKDYKDGTYKEIPWTTITAVVGSLVYIFSPIDLIPDFIPGAGLLDDAAIVSVCLSAISSDLNIYRMWKKLNSVEYKIIKEDTKK
jgi:uncharacterized membrane protein YkvA (DUF1232 family)